MMRANFIKWAWFGVAGVLAMGCSASFAPASTDNGGQGVVTDSKNCEGLPVAEIGCPAGQPQLTCILQDGKAAWRIDCPKDDGADDCTQCAMPDIAMMCPDGSSTGYTHCAKNADGKCAPVMGLCPGQCPPEECGPALTGARACPGGGSSAFTKCERNAETKKCGWVEEGCPAIAGAWGGDHVSLSLTSKGGKVEFDCAEGQLNEALVPAADGSFDVDGLYIQGQGGPSRPDDTVSAEKVRYVGTVVGDRMTLKVKHAAPKAESPEFVLKADTRGNLTRCL